MRLAPACEALAAHVHPSSAALGIARKEIEVDARDRRPGPVEHIVIARLRVPHGNVVTFGEADTEQFLDQFHRAFNHRVGREIGPQRLGIEIERLAPHSLGDIGDIPRFEIADPDCRGRHPHLRQIRLGRRPRLLGDAEQESFDLVG